MQVAMDRLRTNRQHRALLGSSQAAGKERYLGLRGNDASCGTEVTMCFEADLSGKLS